MTGNLPVILIELVLVFGGVLAFAWWQLRSVARDRRESARRAAAAPPPGAEQSSTPAPGDQPPLP